MALRILLVALAFLISLCGSAYRTQQAAWHLPEQWISHPLAVEGQIISLPTTRYSSAHFDFQVTRFMGKQQSTRLSLTWYRPYPSLTVGDTWELIVKLKPLHGLHNPGGFDYEQRLSMQGIDASGYIDNQKPFKKLQHNPWVHPITQLRQHIQWIIQHSISDTALAAIINTLTIGSSSLMSSMVWSVFQNTGTAHLMAISGLHVGLISSVVYFIVYRLWCVFPGLVLRTPAPRAAAIATLLAAILYGLLVGFSLPTQRAVIMIGACTLASLFYQPLPVWRRLVFAFVIVLIFQPWAWSSASFWLSFMAVLWIGYSMRGRLWKNRGFKIWCRLQMAVFLGLLPLTLYFFQRFSLVSILANVLAIPWVSMIIVPLCLLASVTCLFSISCAQWIFWLAAKILLPLWWWLDVLARWPHAVWYHAVSNRWVLFASVIAVFLLLAPKGWPGRWLGWIWALPLFFYRVPGPAVGSIDFTLLDVGQGLSAVVRTANHILVYDTGPRSYGGFDAGAEVVMPYLRLLGIPRLDVLMVSHGDNDHIGGATAILAGLPVAKILTSVPRRFHVPAHYCYTGQHWRWDEVDFQVLSPPKRETYQGNNSSCVLKVSTRAHSLLLSGDIEKPREAWLLTQRNLRLSADVLVAPHHGSGSSSSMAWVKSVGAQDVLFPVGYYNRYGFPNPRVVKRYRDLGAHVFTTSAVGAIQVHIGADGKMTIKTIKNPS